MANTFPTPLTRTAKIDYSKITQNDFDEVLKDLEDMKKKITIQKIIEDNHNYEIYYSKSEQTWRTYLPDDTKRNHRRPVKRKNKEELENVVAEFYIEKKRQADRNAVTLRSLYKEWLIYRRDYTAAKSKTIQENMTQWNHFFDKSELADMSIQDIRPITLIRFFRKVTKDRTYTYKRISNARSVLNGIMDYAIEEEIIESNPVSNVNFKKFTYKPVENQCDNVFSKEDTIRLLKYLKNIDEPYSLAIQLSFYLFIRIGETKALRWEDIDYQKKTLYLHTQLSTERTLNDDLTFSKRRVVVYDQMKGNTSDGYRYQYLTDEALKILSRARRLNPFGTYIFEPYGQPMTTDRFNRKLKAYCEAARVPYHSSHKIRFYNASTAYNGKNLVTISKLMGHSQVETTLHYLRNVRSDEDFSQAYMNLGLSI